MLPVPIYPAMTAPLGAIDPAEQPLLAALILAAQLALTHTPAPNPTLAPLVHTMDCLLQLAPATTIAPLPTPAALYDLAAIDTSLRDHAGMAPYAYGATLVRWLAHLELASPADPQATPALAIVLVMLARHGVLALHQPMPWHGWLGSVVAVLLNGLDALTDDPAIRWTSALLQAQLPSTSASEAITYCQQAIAHLHALEQPTDTVWYETHLMSIWALLADEQVSEATLFYHALAQFPPPRALLAVTLHTAGGLLALVQGQDAAARRRLHLAIGLADALVTDQLSRADHTDAARLRDDCQRFLAQLSEPEE